MLSNIYEDRSQLQYHRGYYRRRYSVVVLERQLNQRVREHGGVLKTRNQMHHHEGKQNWQEVMLVISSHILL